MAARCRPEQARRPALRTPRPASRFASSTPHIAGPASRAAAAMKRTSALSRRGYRQGVAALHLTRHGLRGTVRDLHPESGLPMRDLFSAFQRLSLVAVFGLLALGQAQAANPLEKNFWLSGPRYDGNLPPCEWALGKITSRFAEKESTFWNSALQITGYDRVHEVAFRPWQSDNIPRRYCAATAMVSDGKPRPVYYSIVEDGGFASFGDGVEFCVVGLDRNWAYNPACKAARP